MSIHTMSQPESVGVQQIHPLASCTHETLESHSSKTSQRVVPSAVVASQRKDFDISHVYYHRFPLDENVQLPSGPLPGPDGPAQLGVSNWEIAPPVPGLRDIAGRGQLQKFTVRKLGELRCITGGNASELLQHGYLRRGGALLLVGPTGVGKSTLMLQMLIEWSAGRPAFGLSPTRALRSLLVQAENDEADIVEAREGIFSGLDLNAEQRGLASNAILVAHEDCATGIQFCEALQESVAQHRPDLVVIDPALAFLGGDASSQRDVSEFLRAGLQPVLRQHNCAAILVHHTNKPPREPEKRSRPRGDFAYLGSGSAEWANFARAVVVLESTGAAGQFRLVLGKRGMRAGWRDGEGNAQFEKRLSHATHQDGIVWREIEEHDKDDGIANSDAAKHILELVPAGQQVALQTLVMKVNEKGIGINRVKSLVSVLVEDGLLLESKGAGGGGGKKRMISRGG